MRASEADLKAWQRPAPAKRKLTKSGKPRKKPTPWEENEQVSLMVWLKAVHREMYENCFHVPNGGDRHGLVAKKLKQAGAKKGVSDMLFILPRGGYSGLAIEFKATPPKDSPVSKEQQEWLDRFSANGWRAELCKGKEAAKAVIEDYLNS